MRSPDDSAFCDDLEYQYKNLTLGRWTSNHLLFHGKPRLFLQMATLLDTLRQTTRVDCDTLDPGGIITLETLLLDQAD